MTRRIAMLTAIGFLPACGEPKVVVARIQRNATVPAEMGGSAGSLGTDSGGSVGNPVENPAQGLAGGGSMRDWVISPEQLNWSIYVDRDKTGTSSEWIEQPNAEGLTFTAVSPPDARAGVQFEFADRLQHDLSQYNQVELFVDVIDGDGLELFLGREIDLGCSYVFSRGKSYGSSLTMPTWCKPTQCGFDLQATGGYVLANVPEASRLTARITGMRFYLSDRGARAGSASALGGAFGPSGLCWFLVNWTNPETNFARWVTNPTSSSVRVSATRVGNDVKGMAFEVSKDLKLGQQKIMLVDAIVSGGASQRNTSFLVQAVSGENGRGWTLQGDGNSQTYSIDLTKPEYTFGKGSPSLDDVERIEFVAPSTGNSATIDAEVRGVEFQK